MKKKMIVTAAVLTLSLAMGSMSFAAPAYRASRCVFTDINGDGICDNGDVHCSGFVDADNNGICDICANKQSHNGVCSVNGGHTGHGSHSRTSGSYSVGRHGGRHH